MSAHFITKSFRNFFSIGDISNTPISMLWIKAVFLGPLCLNIFAVQFNYEVVYFNYLFLAILIATNINPIYQRYDPIVKLFLWICFGYVFLGFVNLLREGQGILSFLARNYGVFVAIGAVKYLTRISPSQGRTVCIIFGDFVCAMFLFQLLYSVYESSLSYEFLVNSYDWNGTFLKYEYSPAEMANRLQLSYLFNIFYMPFKIPFNGLLGQHNHWGTQLPFYFLLLGYLYFYSLREKKRFLVFMILVSIAALFNTSRFGIIAIAISGVLFFLFLSTFSSKVKWIIIPIAVFGVIALYFGLIMEKVNDYIALTDTFSGRIETWRVLNGYVFNQGILNSFVGMKSSEIRALLNTTPWSNFENLGYTLIFERGIPYAILFVTFLGVVFKRANLLKPPEKMLARILVINILLVSAWSNVLFRYSSFGLVAVILCIAFLPTDEINSNRSNI